MRRVRSNKSRSSSKIATDSERTQPGINRLKPAKRSRNRVPAPQRERILQKHIAGKSIVEIGREENRNRETVARIVHSDEMATHVFQMREQYYGLLESSLLTLRHGVEKEKDAHLAYKILTDSGVVPTLAERANILTKRESPSRAAAISRIMTGLLVGSVVKLRGFGIDTSDLDKILADAGGRVDDNGELVPIE